METDESAPAAVDCEECEGSGKITPEEPTEDQMDEWREEVRSEFSMVSEPPV